MPYLSGNRKAVKSYLKTCLGIWASPSITTSEDSEEEEDEIRQGAEDKVRISAFLSVRRMSMSADEGVLELVLKVCSLIVQNLYLVLISFPRRGRIRLYSRLANLQTFILFLPSP